MLKRLQWKHMIMGLVTFGLFVGALVTYADYQSDNFSSLIQQKAIEYAKAQGDLRSGQYNMSQVQSSARKLAQDAMTLGKQFALVTALNKSNITRKQCDQSVNTLGSSVDMYLQKASAGAYRTVSIVNGNLVMFIAGGAGKIIYTVLNEGDFCHKDGPTDVDGTYWTAYLYNGALEVIDRTFS